MSVAFFGAKLRIKNQCHKYFCVFIAKKAVNHIFFLLLQWLRPEGVEGSYNELPLVILINK